MAFKDSPKYGLSKAPEILTQKMGSTGVSENYC